MDLRSNMIIMQTLKNRSQVSLMDLISPLGGLNWKKHYQNNFMLYSRTQVALMDLSENILVHLVDCIYIYKPVIRTYLN